MRLGLKILFTAARHVIKLVRAYHEHLLSKNQAAQTRTIKHVDGSKRPSHATRDKISSMVSK